ncbi:MAG: hypothetical protein M0024_13070 [Nitrospiraceae bacterium]|nr:hypothetical protein [Nitrospiraceae bacterium]
MKKMVLLVTLIIAVAFVGSAFAVPPGKTLVFDSSAGKVTFDGKIHSAAGLKCGDCHKEGLFKAMKKGSVKMTMADINAGKFCGACHNGTKAFKSSDAANCGKCHKK